MFKGGTALSKCFGLIQRFSEDIDLIVFRNESDSANQLKTKLKSISSTIDKDLPEIEIKDISFGKTSLEMKIKSTDKNIKAHIHLIGFDKLVSRLEEKTGKTRSQIGIPE